MRREDLRCAVMLVVAALVALPTVAGSLSGTVRTASSEAAPATVVWLEAPAITATATDARAVMDQKKMHFLPHVLAVQVGTTVEFENHDTVVHNVFSPDACAGAFNLGNWGPGGVRSHTFDQACEATILCSLHADMQAWIAVVPTAFFAVTTSDGHYGISDVPAGTYTLKAWSPDSGAHASADVSIQGVTEKDIALR